MKVDNSRKPGRRNTTRFLAMLLAISVMASLTGCTPAFCADNNEGTSFMEQLENAAGKVAVALQKAGGALDGMAEKVIDSLKIPDVPSNTQPTEDPLPPSEWKNPREPACPPFEEELDVYHTYEEIDALLDQEEDDFFVDIYGLYIYALAPTDYPTSVIKEEFKRIYGFEAAGYDFEMVGQFYIDGKDWVPVYKIWVERCYYTPICDDCTEGPYSYFFEDGVYVIGFKTLFGEWENTNVFDENADCWKALEEYEKTDEYKQNVQEMLDRMCQQSGLTVDEMRNDAHYKICCFSFGSNMCDRDGNIFSMFYMHCRYDPDLPQTEEPTTATEPSEDSVVPGVE